MDLTNLAAINQQKAQEAKDLQRQQELLSMQSQLQEVIVRSFNTLVEYLDKRVSKTEVVNQLRSIGTPDALRVAEAVNSLHDTIKTHENTDLTEITAVMREVLGEAKKIPKELPEQQEIKLHDYSDQLKSLESAIKAVEKVVKEQKLIAEAPIVNLPETQVNVEAPNLKPLQKAMADVVSAVNKIVFPEFDTTSVEKLIEKSNKLLQKLIDKPVSSGGGGGGGRATPYEDSNGIPHFVIVESDGSIPVTIKADESTSIVYSKPLDEYQLVQDAETATHEYYGYVRADGSWCLKRTTIATNYSEFVRGASDYTTAWTNRATQTYQHYWEAF